MIDLSLVTFPLEIDLLKYSCFPKHVMAAANSFFEAEFDEQSSQILKSYVCVGGSAQNLKEKFIVPAHPCEPSSNYGRYDLADAALQLAIVGDG